MTRFYIVTNGIDGGISTVRFDDREAILVFEDKGIAFGFMRQLPKGALVELELDSRQALTCHIESFLSAQEFARIELLFPDAPEYWPLLQQLQNP